MYLRVTLTGGECAPDGKWAWVSRVGHALIDNVELEIGGTKIDKQYGDWLNVWYELARNWAHDRGYDKMIGNSSELTTLGRKHDAATLYIPLRFFCNRNDGLAIPLIALQYHEVKVHFEFRPLNQCVVLTENVATSFLSSASAPRMQDATLFVEYVYLDTEERKRFAQAQHEYLIEQLQFTGQESVSSVSQKFRLNFNHPCKAIYWAAQLGRYTSGKDFLAYNPRNLEAARVEASKRFVLSVCALDVSGALDVDGSVLKLKTAAGGTALVSTATAAIFNRINAVAITTAADVDNITILGDLLTVEEFSKPVEQLFGSDYANRNTTGDGRKDLDVKVYQWDNWGQRLDRNVNLTNRALLQLNGHDRFSERDGHYFNYVQPFQHHSNTPADGVNMYSFSLNPEEHQPSGTCNMSRIDNATLNITFGDGTNTFKSEYLADDSKVAIYATSYNILRIMSGMGGLAYSN